MSTLSLVHRESKALPSWMVVGLGVLLFWVCANFKIFLPISPVPITMHTFAVLVLGSLLTFRQSLVTMGIVYALSFFSVPFVGAPLALSPICLGYYIGWTAALFLLSQLKDKVPLLPLLFSVSYLVILGLGFAHLQFVVGAKAAWTLGVVPFLIGDACKALAAYLVLEKFKKVSSKISL